MEKPIRVFLSYAREDRGSVEKVYRKLLEAGIKPWMDVKDILPGDLWESNIKKALRESDFVLIFLSRHSIDKRGSLQKEIKSALEILEEMLEGDIYLIPVRLEDCEIPRSIRSFHFLDLYEEAGWSKLLKAIFYGIEKKGKLDELRKSLEKDEFKSHLFIAMPFNKEMEDRYYYGIQRAADANGFACKRIDKDYFTGDILQQIKIGIDTSSAVIADLTDANPNVYLEIGYAWGKEIPTILLIEEAKELYFDVRGHRCLMYTSIRHLEELLTKELEKLKTIGII